MKIGFTSNIGNVTTEIEGQNQKDIFEGIAEFQEVFDEPCSKCGSDNIRYVVRENNENKYYEKHCSECKAKLAFGAHRNQSTLFPKRKDSNGDWVGKNGWGAWNKESGKVE